MKSIKKMHSSDETYLKSNCLFSTREAKIFNLEIPTGIAC